VEAGSDSEEDEDEMGEMEEFVREYGINRGLLLYTVVFISSGDLPLSCSIIALAFHNTSILIITH